MVAPAGKLKMILLGWCTVAPAVDRTFIITTDDLSTEIKYTSNDTHICLA